MKVKCIDNKKIVKKGIYQGLKIGKEYLVLAIEFYDKSISTFCQSIGDFTLYRIQDNDGVIIPYPAKLFEVVSNQLSKNWVTFHDEDSYSILPKSWARSGFWEDYYNDEKEALNSYVEEIKVINAEQN